MKKNVIRLLMSLVALVTMGNVAFAENKLSIASIGDGEFAVLMDCDENAIGLQFNLQLPPQLDIVEQTNSWGEKYLVRNPLRFSNGQQISSGLINGSKQNVICMVVSRKNEPFIGENGTAVATFKTRKREATSTWKNEDMKLTEIVFSAAGGVELPSANVNGESTYEGKVYGELAAYFDVKSLTINPSTAENETEVKIPVALKNSFIVSALQMNIALPAGFTMSDQFEHTDRVTTSAYIDSKQKGNVYGIAISDIVSNQSIKNTGDGVIFYITVKAPTADQFSTDGEFKIYDVLASTIDKGNVTTVNGVGQTLNVTNGYIAKANADEAIKALQDALDAALATIADECPDVKDNFNGADIQTAIDNLSTAVDNAYNDLTLTPDYKDVVETPAAAIKADIEKLVADAKAAQAAEANRKAANQSAYNDVKKVLEGIQANYNTLVETFATPEWKDYAPSQEKIEAVGNQIEQALTDAQNALTTAQETPGGVFSFPQTTIDELQNAVDSLEEEANLNKDNANNEEKRKAENEKAYNAVVAQIDDLQDKLDAAKAAAAENLPDFTPEAAINAAQNLIDEAKAAAEAEKEAKADAGVYEYTVDAAPIETAIAAIRTAANELAYEADVEAVETLFANYRSVCAEINKDYKEFEDLGAENVVKNEIEAAEKAVEKAKKAVENAGYYVTPLDAAAIQTAIDQLLADAKQKDADKKESDRKAANEAAYNAVKAEIAALQAKLNAAVAEIDEKYADYKDEAAIKAVQDLIDSESADALAAYNKVAEAGEFEYTVNAAPIEEKINALVPAAEAAKKAAEEEAARVAANEAAYNAALDQIAAIEKHYDEVVAEIAKDYAEYADADAESAVKSQIEAAKAAAKAALDKVATEGTFEYTVPAADLNSAIDLLLENAKAAKKAAEDQAEADRQAANKAAYEADLAAIDALMTTYLDAVKEIKDNYGKFEDTDAESAVLNSIIAAKEEVNNAYNAVVSEGIYKSPLDQEAILASIQKLIDDAIAAKDADDKAAAAEAERVANNAAAYEVVTNEIKALQDKLNATVAQINTECEGYGDAEANAAVQAQIDAVKAAADAAYAAVEKEGTFDYTFDAAPIYEAIDELLKNAQDKKAAAEAEAARKAANEAAYNAVLEALAEIQNHYNDVVAQVESEYPAYVDADANAAVQAQIDAAKAAADAAYAAVAEEGRFDYELDADALNAAINKLLTDAEAKAKHDQEVEDARKAANEAAYNAVLSTLAEVQAYFDETVADIKANLAIFSDPDANAAVQAKIDAVKAAADAAYAAVENEGNFDYTVDVVPLYEAIDALADNAEAARVTYNNDSYNVVMTVIESLQAQFEAARESIITEYPTYDYFAEATEINNAINAAKAGADAALEAVAEAGLFKYNFDADAIRKMIDEMLANAVKSGVSMVEIENGEVMIFTLDGKRHFNLVQGEVNVIVRKNGEREKVMVK
ncbi:MAG: DUF4407 domain-containing protein [Muribaculum sp.]|nr:DUF4407 domain-containing protein [Muribaculum sp.]